MMKPTKFDLINFLIAGGNGLNIEQNRTGQYAILPHKKKMFGGLRLHQTGLHVNGTFELEPHLERCQFCLNDDQN